MKSEDTPALGFIEKGLFGPGPVKPTHKHRQTGGLYQLCAVATLRLGVGVRDEQMLYIYIMPNGEIAIWHDENLTGGVLMGRGMAQVQQTILPRVSVPIVLYRDVQRRWFVRPTADFDDGRFEVVTTTHGVTVDRLLVYVAFTGKRVTDSRVYQTWEQAKGELLSEGWDILSENVEYAKKVGPRATFGHPQEARTATAWNVKSMPEHKV